jgi:hypothetical protein
MEQITGAKRNAAQAGLPTATSLAPSRGAGDQGDSTHATFSAMDEDNGGPAEVDPQRRDLLRQLEDIERERLALQQGVLFGYSQDACSSPLAHGQQSHGFNGRRTLTVGSAPQPRIYRDSADFLGRCISLCRCRVAPALPAEMQRV